MKKAIILLLILTATACKKSTSVKVRVYDVNAEINVPGVQVALFEDKQSSQLFGIKNEVKKLSEGYTDANGEILFSDFDTRNNDNYQYAARITQYNGQSYSFYAYIGNDAIAKGKNSEQTIPVHSYGNILIQFIPPPPYPAGDSLYLIMKNSGGGGLSVGNTDYLNYYPHVLYSPYSGYDYISIKKYKSGVYTYTLDTIYLAPNEHREYDVYF